MNWIKISKPFLLDLPDNDCWFVVNFDNEEGAGNQRVIHRGYFTKKYFISYDDSERYSPIEDVSHYQIINKPSLP